MYIDIILKFFALSVKLLHFFLILFQFLPFYLKLSVYLGFMNLFLHFCEILLLQNGGQFIPKTDILACEMVFSLFQFFDSLL